MSQVERPAPSAADLLHNLGLAANTEVRMSGGKIENFRKGWAVAIMSGGERAHWFTREGFAEVSALCGAAATVRWMYGAGDYPRCSNCIKVMSRRNKTGRPV